MVRLVNPQIGEKVYDPFCGTGGFLIESFRYIYNNMARTTVNEKILKEDTVYGHEITNTARITKMNMILAGDGQMPIRKSSTGSGYWYSGAYRPFGISMTWHKSANAGHIVIGQVASNGTSVKYGYSDDELGSSRVFDKECYYYR